MTSNFSQKMVNQDQEIIFEVVKVSGNWAFPAAKSIIEATKGKNMYLRLTDDGKSDIFRLDYVKDGESAGETVFGFVGNGGMDLVELTATTDGTGTTTGIWDYEPGEGPAGKSNKIAVFEVNLGHGVQYPTFNDVKQAVDSGKVPVLHIVNYNGTSDSPADYFFIVNYNSAPNYHSYSFSNGVSFKTVNSSNEWSDTRAARYTTRTETATNLPASIDVNDGESILYNVNIVGSGVITITAPAGTTDAQVAIISTGSSFYINTSNLSVTVGGVSIPVFDLRLPDYFINAGREYAILKSTYQPGCSTEVPPSFDEVALVEQVLTDADILERARYTKKMVVQIVGQVALVLAK